MIIYDNIYIYIYDMVVSGISCPETIFISLIFKINKKSSRGDMSVRISRISKIH